MGLFKKKRRKPTRSDRELALEWTRTLWERRLWKKNTWLGLPILQWPTDLLVLQELIFRERPDLIIETGTNRGGSAIFFASILAHCGGGKVVSVEFHPKDGSQEAIRAHPLGDRVHLIHGDSKAPDTIERVKLSLDGARRVMVFLDADHSFEHVLAELRGYAPFVSPGMYLIAFDTICRWLAGRGGAPETWAEDNPHRAVEGFLKECSDFERDPSFEKLLVTFAPGGFLRRKK